MVSHESLPRIVQLANVISASTTKIQEVLTAKNLPSPSFDEDYHFELHPEAAEAHDAVLDATAELHDLLSDPHYHLYRHAGHNNLVCLRAIAEFRIADMVPPNDSISYSDIAKRTPMTEALTTRLLRHAMTMRIFCEKSDEPGMVAHTAVSKLLHTTANDYLLGIAENSWPAAAKTVDALEKWPRSEEPNETGYCLAKDTMTSMYDVFYESPESVTRWAEGMRAYAARPQFGVSWLANYFDWASLGQAQVVDVGGAQGHISIGLAKLFPHLTFIVQDLEKMIQAAKAPEEDLELRQRVRFMAHDFFGPQPVKDAEVYLIRMVFHNWSNKYCLRILHGLVPALKFGAKIIIQDNFMPEPGTVAQWKEKRLRANDINMTSLFNAQERTVAEMKSLLQQADSRFSLRNAITPTGSGLTMLEVVWESSAS
ncbi:unnamed protein product [Discula destructiva]